MENKVCTKCSLIKNLESYPKRDGSKDGYRNVCKVCYNNEKKKDKLKYIEKNRDKYLLNRKINYRNNSEKIKKEAKIRSQKWRKDNPEKYKKQLSVYQKLYRENNKEKRSVNHKIRKINDPLYKLRCLISSTIQKQLKNNGYSKKSRTREILGCSYTEYLKHIEMQWLLPHNLDDNGNLWMNWDNHGKYNGTENYGWDIDHVIPLSSAKTEEELLELFKYTNLQPLCSYINRVIKRDNL
jgi:hypothetical protein